MQFENDEQAIAYLQELQATNPPEPEYEPVLVGDAMNRVLEDVLERNGAV